MKNRGFIKSIVAIVIILSVALLSQQPYFQKLGRNLYSKAYEQGNMHWLKAKDWFLATIYPKISSEVEKRGDTAKEEITKQKDVAAQSIWEKIKNYFAEKFSKISGTKVE